MIQVREAVANKKECPKCKSQKVEFVSSTSLGMTNPQTGIPMPNQFKYRYKCLECNKFFLGPVPFKN